MTRLSTLLVAVALLGFPIAATAQEANLSFGGDQFTAGQNASIEAAVANDAFLAGYDVGLTAAVGGDAHLAGFNVTSSAAVTGDLYAVGFNVTVNNAVGGDVTAAGNNVALRSPQPVAGNVRLAGQNVAVGSGVGGSAIVTAQTLTLDGPITGDLVFFGDNIIFATGARIDGTVAIHAPEEIAVPASVASADRVRFEPLVRPDYMGEAGRTAQNIVSGFWPVFWTVAAWWVVLVVIGSGFIALMPRGLAAMQAVSETRPFRRLGLGILAFAATIGLVPVFAITIVGILLLPFVLLFVFIACSLAYLAGVYFAGHRLARAFIAVETNLQRLAVLAVSLIAAALLGIVPVLGWLITLLLLVFGFGVIAAVLIVRWSSGDAARLSGATPAAASPTPGAA